MSRLARLAAAACAAVGAATGCLTPMGLGLSVQLPNETYPGERAEVTGVLEVARNGCFELVVGGARHFVIWPAGSGHAADQVRLPTGELVGQGELITARGALTPTAPLIQNDDGYWAYAVRYCAPNAAEVLVLDTAAVLR